MTLTSPPIIALLCGLAIVGAIGLYRHMQFRHIWKETFNQLKKSAEDANKLTSESRFAIINMLCFLTIRGTVDVRYQLNHIRQQLPPTKVIAFLHETKSLFEACSAIHKRQEYLDRQTVQVPLCFSRTLSAAQTEHLRQQATRIHAERIALAQRILPHVGKLKDYFTQGVALYAT